ncbi:MAG: IscS subfamily cysteine desulfurase [Candidatus Marinimicrobia bacterium]|nr:IscS subfamily cysteine desulfurase [Candidatus Neomarinimicrobiota bacterium]
MNKIYLDNNSTTKLDPQVLDAMIPYFNEKYGNASSRTHHFGWEAEAAIEIARKNISNLIKCKSSEVIFTSGATESNNISLHNILDLNKSHLITMSIEHKAILDVCSYLESKNINVSYLKPNKNGLINLKKIKESITKETGLVSIMHANNEIGVIQPIKEIGEICKKNNILFHVDAAQSFGKIDIDVKKMNVDLLSISGHKIYGPKGIGALFINESKKIRPLFFGGSQEKNIRPGTLPVPLIVGLGEASKIASEKMTSDFNYILKLKNLLFNKIKKDIPDVIINGDFNKRIPGNLNLSFPCIEGQSIVTSLSKVAASSGSACSSSIPKPSHVLLDIGLNKQLIQSSIRIGIGRFNTEDEILIAAENIIKTVKNKIQL